MHLERLGTWLHGGPVGRDVGFLDMPQFPPEHVECCRRVPPRKSAGSCLKTAYTSDAATSQKLMHCTVTSMLLCSFSSSLIVSYHFPIGSLSFLMPPFSLTGWLQVHLQQFRDQGQFFYHLFQSECCFDHFVLGGLFFQRVPFQLPLVSVDLVLQ